MIPLIGAVFLASVLGSLHCAGMCGAFLAFAVGTGGGAQRPWRLHAAYHLGRLTTYTILGGVAGGVGAAIDLGGSLVGVQRAAAVLSGLMMIVFGAAAVLRLCGLPVARSPVPAVVRRLAEAGHRRAFDLPPVWRAAAVGLLTTLLPCGWLWAFVATAAGTAGPERGAVAMAVFWLGTLPALVTLGAGVHAMAGALRRRIPMVTALALVAVGLWTIAGRMTLPAAAMAPRQPTQSQTQRGADAVPQPGSAECCRER